MPATDTLIQLGLTKTEASVWNALLKHGPCFAGTLISETRKHRQIVYNALDGLIRRNLVETSKRNGKNFYSVGDASRLLTDIKQKELLAREVLREIKEKTHLEDERVEVYKGAQSYEQGLANFRLNAEKAEEYIVIGGEPSEWFEFVKPFFLEHVREVRRLKTRGIDALILFYEQERKSAEKYIAPFLKDPYTCKVAPNYFRLPHTAWLAGDNVYILTPAKDPLVVHIKSRVLADEYRTYFWKIWTEAKIVR